MPSTLSHSTLTPKLCGNYPYYFHFTDEATEAQKNCLLALEDQGQHFAWGREERG